MQCPYCSSIDNKVVDSRIGKEGDAIRRRRECLKCERRFTTYERVEDVLPFVIKKDSRREQYDRLKILQGIKKACEKRPISVEALEKVVDNIEKSIQDRGLKEIPSTIIGEEVMSHLHGLDEVAYVRFASVYRSFKDINEFMDELKDILNTKEMRALKNGVGRDS
ncbi:MAG: transcriptional regulator NrdR [Nitrospirae bacterium GWC2_57_13]|jgi:transcriptional repressor NrdR|nr:MAG: transcriptional regulator NrdR [Nitrospirae bacterium GWC1_57_7]OGW29620.1 MAG: transcriptional regulator NrdR [Nitrospirae bacterium GWC2_57_13]OGW42748.1 MAG: transcriptional regulator NrdR [Nitrospirae bacterium GWD2_57_8]HAR46501.1 transcriptional regulator NrdR [Nitrospiraceae bacterium]HAS54074.1 transcriptional regulator NrdR [Nitrospiraceae bacterium]